MELIRSYFPDLSERQQQQLSMLGPLYREWNEKINVISRKDIDHLYEHHVLHSLALARLNPFQPGMRVLDAGTGGGFPGIPLAIIYPDVKFTLLDSTAKKIKVVNEIATALGLENVTGVHSRIEDYEGTFDLIISRAVSSLEQMIEWSKHLVPSQHWIIFKGGDPMDFRKELPPYFDVKAFPISDWFKEEYFLEKYLVEVKRRMG
jgi:16S rRNA (guanine527-N7)-methyltransferase